MTRSFPTWQNSSQERLLGFRRLGKMIKTIAVDIGNVSVFIDTFAFPRALGLTEGFTPEMRELQRRVEWGEIPDELFFSELVKLAPGWSEKRLRTLFDSILLTPVPGMEELLAKLSASGVQVVFFSDISPAHLKGFRQRFPSAANYPGIYSFDVGAWKPSPKMFEAFEKSFGKPDIYVDDRLDLVEAAQQYGWNAQLFQNAGWLERLVF